MLRIFAAVGIEKPQKSDFFTVGNKTPGHFERNDAAKRSATEIIRATWLMQPHPVDVRVRHFIDGAQIRYAAIKTLRLKRENRLIVSEVTRQNAKKESVATRTRNAIERRLGSA